MTSKLQAHFLNLYSMALADADFDEKEIEILYRMGEEREIPKETIDSMLLSPPNSDDLYVPDTITEKIEYLYDYAKMLLADGIVHENEVKTLEKFCAKFQFEEKNIPTIAQLLIEAAKNNIPKGDLVHFVTQNN